MPPPSGSSCPRDRPSALRDQPELLEHRDAVVESDLLGDHAVDDLDHLPSNAGLQSSLSPTATRYSAWISRPPSAATFRDSASSTISARQSCQRPSASRRRRAITVGP